MTDNYKHNVSYLIGVTMGYISSTTFEQDMVEKNKLLKAMYNALDELTVSSSDLHIKEMMPMDIIQVFEKHKKQL